ncbi:helix-turn-helix transcriptional regulator [Arachidicoccus soli]|uniref:Helix-turn-helix domain-containing protein n=1 Tax=Arachidicoccus soli TaxID=2341117 RepID=A0A386HUG0_9BACT|nr:helix-turn-helix domain-containing protein [Arachidicoccus soli]AYD49016.1 helix-turn-helix domain-containing protein [Arachidicoccus soli]
MKTDFEIAKGIHPGLILERELRQRNMPQGQFALSIDEYPQTINAIINGKRSMNTKLAMRIEEALEIKEGSLMTLQIFYEIKEEKKKLSKKKHPALSKFRPAVFWDTNIESIDWNKQKKTVVKRVFEYGNFTEKKEVLNYYGRDTIRKILTA